MQLVSSSCGCLSEQHAGLFVRCDRGTHGLGVTNLRHVTRRELVAQVDAWIAVSPNFTVMLERVDYAARHGITGDELLRAGDQRHQGTP